MRIGTDTGSVINAVPSGTNGQPTPEVGMGITLLHWTDRSAGTITRVSVSGKTFWFKDDVVARIDANGMSESQEYAYAPGDGPEKRAGLTKRGWKQVGGPRIALGYRRAYHDYSF